MTMVNESTYEINLSNLTVNRMAVMGLQMNANGYFAKVVGGACGRSGRSQLNIVEISDSDWGDLFDIAKNADLIWDVTRVSGLFDIALGHDDVVAWLAGQVQLATMFEEAALTAEDVSMGVVI